MFAISMVFVNFTWLVLLLQAQNFLAVQVPVAQVLQKLRVHRLNLLPVRKVHLAQKVHQNLLQAQVALRVNRQVNLLNRPTIIQVQQILPHPLNLAHLLSLEQQTVGIHHNKKRVVNLRNDPYNTSYRNVGSVFLHQKYTLKKSVSAKLDTDFFRLI